MVKTCTELGVTVVWPEREIRPGVRIAMVADPDGNWVEFLQVG
jgi:predicted enzyme related to lactoylglutathione lyase